MAKNILVATPQPAFGEFLRLSLEESNQFRVRLVHNGRDALTSMDQNVFSLAILDAALLDPPYPYVVQGLRNRRPDIRLLVISPAENEKMPEIRATRPDGFVGQPFYAPSLLETIDQLTAETPAVSTAPAVQPPQAAASQNTPPPDAAQAAQVLEGFLQDSTAPAVLLLRACQPWAWAGQLNRDTLDEVARLLTHYAEANEGVDIARFVHLQTDGGEYLLYATPQPEAMVLVMVYAVTTPLTVIRAQALRLTRLLRMPPIALPQASSSPTPSSPSMDLPAAPAAVAPTSTSPPAQPPILPTAADAQDDQPDETESDDGRLEADTARLVDLLTAMPTPNPSNDEPSDWVREDAPAGTDAGFIFPWEHHQPAVDLSVAATLPSPGSAPTIAMRRNGPSAAPATPTVPPGVPTVSLVKAASPNVPLAIPETHTAGPAVPGNFPADILAAEPQLPVAEEDYSGDSEELARTDLDTNGQLADKTLPTGSLPPTTLLNDWLAASAPTASEDTRPVVLRTLQSLQQVEPIMPSFSHLAYTCLLIPRLPAHALSGELAERLQEWLPQLCMAYGWRLENLVIRPECLQWTVHVAPAISPGNVIRLVRQQSSRRIFLRFPQYEMENPSGDFWAPGFLIISGFQPPSINIVQDFIRQTRTRQGAATH